MTRVGIIGLGIMGRPMARNLVTAGYALRVFNRSQAAVEELVAFGALAADSPRDLAMQCEVIVTMLPDSPQVVQIATGPGGILEGAREGTLIIDMSTISPVVTRQLAALAGNAGVAWLDAPVSGGDIGAREGTLSIMAGGSGADFERAYPLFEVLGATIVHVGPVGSGQVVKACNQLVVALTIEAVSEALVLGSKAGVDPAVILQVLSGGLAGSRVMDIRGRNFLEHDFEPGFRVDLHHKDLGIALATGREYGVPLPATAAVSEMLQSLRARGKGDRDHSVLLTHLEELADHRTA